jgi:sugar phosphate permease
MSIQVTDGGGPVAVVSASKGAADKVLDDNENVEIEGDKGGSGDDKLSTWQLFRLCVPVIPSQLGWAVGEALLIPYMISLGVDETAANAIWLVNPMVGFFVSPLIGSCSDTCNSKWGRRRPFLLIFHIGIALGLIIIAFAKDLLLFFTDLPA